MLLVDTSVWISHLRDGNIELASLLNDAKVICHPFIIGEIAQINQEEVLYFIDKHQLMGKGLGYVDIHLCASAMITGIPIWTLDKRLDEINQKLKLSYPGHDAPSKL